MASAPNPNKYPRSVEARRPNGYIIRVRMKDGQLLYRPELVRHLTESRGNRRYYRVKCERFRCAAPGPLRATRHIALPQQYWFWYSENANEKPTSFEPATPKERPRTPRTVALGDDPIEDGELLARSEIPLPSDRIRSRSAEAAAVAGQRRAASGEPSLCSREEKEVAELYRQGLLYNSDDAGDDGDGEPDLSLNSIQHDEPTYTIRHVAKGKKGRKSRSPVTRAPESPEQQLLVVPDDILEQISSISDAEEFEFILDDDVLSVAESWVELESRPDSDG